MQKGSYATGFLGALCGVLIALLAIFIGASTVHLFGGPAENAAAHGAAGEHR